MLQKLNRKKDEGKQKNALLSRKNCEENCLLSPLSTLHGVQCAGVSDGDNKPIPLPAPWKSCLLPAIGANPRPKFATFEALATSAVTIVTFVALKAFPMANATFVALSISALATFVALTTSAVSLATFKALAATRCVLAASCCVLLALCRVLPALHRIIRKDLGMKSWVVTKVQGLTPNQRQKRFDRCKILLNRLKRGSKHVLIFSDEKIFTIDAVSNSRSLRYIAQTPEDVKPVIKFTGRTKHLASALMLGIVGSDGKAFLPVWTKGTLKMDQYMSMLALKFILVLPTTIQCVSVAAVIMMIIALVFIPKPICAIWVAFSIISIELGVIGLMSLWSVTLDSISMINLIMCIGFSVDFSAHISYHFMAKSNLDKDERVSDCMHALGLPITQGAISTILGVIGLALAPSYIFVIFFKMVFLVIFLGALHGLFLLPVLLTAFEGNNDGRALFRAFLQKEYAEENLDFVIKVGAYRTCSPRKRAKMAWKLYRTFIAIGAPHELNLDILSRKTLSESSVEPSGHANNSCSVNYLRSE
eukprot:snap_masked-scaffold627_size122700-processed-gene-0.20 protein:Tk10660 transcript:snap_masked-scaffold627_size122700-processed-gene-0.20-mRNA-1 annotation:"hypothetical protein AND_001302"